MFVIFIQFPTVVDVFSPVTRLVGTFFSTLVPAVANYSSMKSDLLETNQVLSTGTEGDLQTWFAL